MNAALAYILLWYPWDTEATSETCPLRSVLLRITNLCRSHTGPDWKMGGYKSCRWITPVTASPKDAGSTQSTAIIYPAAALTVRKPGPLAAWDIEHRGRWWATIYAKRYCNVRNSKNRPRNYSMEYFPMDKKQQKEDRASFRSSFTSSYPKMVSSNLHSGFSERKSFVEHRLQCQLWQ